MDLKWFLRYLTLTRWSKLFAVLLACIFFGITAYYFMYLQKNYKQREWRFVNAFKVDNGLILEPKKVYKIEWENGGKVYPAHVNINGLSAHVLNYFKLPYARDQLGYYCNVTLSSPCYIRVKDSTDFKLSFISYTYLKWNSGFKEFISSWFDSFSDPFDKVEWTVTDVTDTYDHELLTVDGKFPIVKVKY